MESAGAAGTRHTKPDYRGRAGRRTLATGAFGDGAMEGGADDHRQHEDIRSSVNTHFYLSSDRRGG